jgi:diguanylate cyclase (GGDEF)-like protein
MRKEDENADPFEDLVHSLSQRLMARFFSVLLMSSGIVSALVHPLPNLTDMSTIHRAAITTVCVVGGVVIWFAPWDRWPRQALLVIPPIGIGVKLWANSLGGLGPYSYSIQFVWIYVWMGVALPRWTPLRFSPLLAAAYAFPLMLRGDPRQVASMAMVVPICVVIGESVAWISNRLREVEQVDGQHLLWMRWLLERSAQLAQMHERRATVESIAELGCALPGTDGTAVLLAGDGRSLEVAASADWAGSLPERFNLTDNPVMIEAIRTGEVIRQIDPRCQALAAELGVPAVGVAPLFGSSRCMGLVLFARKLNEPEIDSFTHDLIRTLRVQAGLAIERMRDREQLRESSLHDTLTGLGNRRKADERLSKLSTGDALLLIDLDHFKRINDTQGHAAGDEVLRGLGGFLAESLRESDEAFRFGGEEFLVVLEKAGDGAKIAAERLCEGWRRRDPATTFSAGIAVHTAESAPDETLARADGALYAAKEAGRDRVATAEPDSSELRPCLETASD